MDYHQQDSLKESDSENAKGQSKANKSLSRLMDEFLDLVPTPQIFLQAITQI